MPFVVMKVLRHVKACLDMETRLFQFFHDFRLGFIGIGLKFFLIIKFSDTKIPC